MTAPIPFVPTPHDTDTDDASAPDAFQAFATTTDANFELVNAFLRAPQEWPNFATNDQIAPLSIVGTARNAWTDFPAAQWAPLSITPTVRTQLLVVGMAGRVQFSAGPGFQPTYACGIGFRLSAGSTDTTIRNVLHVQDGALFGGGITVILPTTLTPGTAVKIQPMYIVEAATGATGYYQDLGTLFGIALV